MTENTIGIWKRRFPAIQWMRVDLQNAQKFILASANLHNLSYMWGEVVPGAHPEEDQIPLLPDANEVRVIEDLTAMDRRRTGRQTRDQLRLRMEADIGLHHLQI